MKKSLFTILLALLPMVASADAVEIDGIYYNLSGNDAEVTRNPDHVYMGSMSIPEKIEYEGTEYNVTSIGEKAFRYSGLLTSITIPGSVTNIGDEAFFRCNGLTSVTIPNSVTNIGNNAFCLCYELASITIGNSVKSIRNYTFSGCSSLTTITIPNSVTFIGANAFSDCTNLTSVTIGNSVTDIGTEAFSYCKKLTSITIPNSVTYIGENAFYNCSSLISVTIGESVNRIRSYSFAKCRQLTDVFCLAKNVPNTNADAFDSSNIENATLHVPDALLEEYMNAEPWKNFMNKVTFALNVKLNKTKVNLEMTKTLTLKATVTPTAFPDKSVIWESSNTEVATVSTGGEVKGIKDGTATITCTSNATGAKGTCIVTVIDGGVKLDKTATFIEKGNTLTLKATVTPTILTDKSVTWKSSNTKVATVSTGGEVKGVKAGTATITCTSKATGFSATCKVTVGYVKLDKTEAVIEKTKTLTLTPTVYPSSLEDKSVKWKSSNTKVVTVSTAGELKGVKAGTATITCTSNATGLSTTCKVTVGYVKLDKTEAIIKKGKTLTLKPTVYPSALEDKSVKWKSSNTAVATVTSTGKVKGVKTGTATITCTSVATGLSTTCEVLVGNVVLNKYTANLKKGKTVTLKATVYPSSLEDRSVTWKSSDTKIATVTSSGKVKGIGYGTATITCTSVATGLSRTCQVTVGDVILDKTEATVKKGKTVTLTPTVYPSTLEDKSVTWESSDKSVATVTTAGKVKGVKAGTVTITCTSNATGLSTTCKVTVTSTSSSRSIEGDEDDDDDTTGIETIEEAPALAEPYDVYDLSGHEVRHQVTSLDGLPAGVYIVNGKKILKK